MGMAIQGECHIGLPYEVTSLMQLISWGGGGGGKYSRTSGAPGYVNAELWRSMNIERFSSSIRVLTKEVPLKKGLPQ